MYCTFINAFLNMKDPFMHFLCFGGCLLDLETKPRLKGKKVISALFQSIIRLG